MRLSGSGAGQNGHANLAADVSVSGVATSTATAPTVVYKLRCEMAHKNMYLKDNDPTIRRAHRPMLLLPNPGAGSQHAVAAAMQVRRVCTCVPWVPPSACLSIHMSLPLLMPLARPPPRCDTHSRLVSHTPRTSPLFCLLPPSLPLRPWAS